MIIRFTSSLTPEDENLVAPALLKSLGSILGLMPIAYVLRIETSDGNAYQCGASSPSVFKPEEAVCATTPFEIES